MMHNTQLLPSSTRRRYGFFELPSQLPCRQGLVHEELHETVNLYPEKISIDNGGIDGWRCSARLVYHQWHLCGLKGPVSQHGFLRVCSHAFVPAVMLRCFNFRHLSVVSSLRACEDSDAWKRLLRSSTLLTPSITHRAMHCFLDRCCRSSDVSTRSRNRASAHQLLGPEVDTGYRRLL